MIEKSKELAKTTEANYIVLETHILNDNAQKLYEKIGFKKDDEHYYYLLEV